MLRDGIEDYEYHATLQRLIEEKDDELSEAARKRYEALLAVPDDVTGSLTEFTRDPAPIEQRRRELAEAIAELSQM